MRSHGMSLVRRIVATPIAPAAAGPPSAPTMRARAGAAQRRGPAGHHDGDASLSGRRPRGHRSPLPARSGRSPRTRAARQCPGRGSTRTLTIAASPSAMVLPCRPARSRAGIAPRRTAATRTRSVEVPAGSARLESRRLERRRDVLSRLAVPGLPVSRPSSASSARNWTCAHQRSAGRAAWDTVVPTSVASRRTRDRRRIGTPQRRAETVAHVLPTYDYRGRRGGHCEGARNISTAR